MKNWIEMYLFAMLFMIYYRASRPGSYPTQDGAIALIVGLVLAFLGLVYMWGDLVRS
jgi:multisubunit Na+/H+ antiporter MnhB subunit